MRKIFWMTFCALALLSFSAPAHAQTHLIGWNSTGNDFVSTCGDTSNAISAGECFGYLQGAVDGYREGAVHQYMFNGGTEIADQHTFINDLCIPNGVTGEQLRKVVLHYADAHPDKLNQASSTVIKDAIWDAWGMSSKGHPCDPTLGGVN
jgi:Rap1a immunity proteins